MEWKKIASMDYGKIAFHFIPCPAQQGRIKEKRIGNICPGAHFQNTHHCRNAKIINHYFFLKIHKFFMGASPTRAIVTSYHN